MKNLKTFEGVFEDMPDLIEPGQHTLEDINTHFANVYKSNTGVVSGDQVLLKETGYVLRADVHELLLILKIKAPGIIELNYYRDNTLAGQLEYKDVTSVEHFFELSKKELDEYMRIFSAIDVLSYEVIGLENQITEKEGTIIKLVDQDLYEI